jgi:hypothetical protein
MADIFVVAAHTYHENGIARIRKILEQHLPHRLQVGVLEELAAKLNIPFMGVVFEKLP